MTEPTIDEMLEWLTEVGKGIAIAGSGQWYVYHKPEVLQAIRAILEQVKQLRENITTFDPEMQQSLVAAIVQVTAHNERPNYATLVSTDPDAALQMVLNTEED